MRWAYRQARQNSLRWRFAFDAISACFTDAWRSNGLALISGLYSLPLAPLADSPEETPCAEHTAYATKSVRAESGPPIDDHRFLAGPENMLVRALAEAALADPLVYNPLVLCGPTGVGKTSVALALAAQRRERFGFKHVVNTTGSDVLRGLKHAIESDSTADFRSRFQRCDLLVIDELHRLAGKAAAQQFLIIALDALLKRGVLVIATLPRLPHEIEGLSPALASRLLGGLVVPLAPPGPLARCELVREAAEQIELSLSEDAIAQLAGANEQGHVFAAAFTAPRLRHAVLQLSASANGRSRKHRPAEITELLAAERPEPKAVFRQATLVVAKHFDLTATQLKSKSRLQHIADARGLAMFVSRRLTGASYAEIGRFFGNRDHSTVLHACQKTEKLIASDEALHRLVEDLQSRAGL